LLDNDLIALAQLRWSSVYQRQCKGPGKATVLRSNTGPECARRLRLFYLETVGTWRWSICQP